MSLSASSDSSKRKPVSPVSTVSSVITKIKKREKNPLKNYNIRKIVSKTRKNGKFLRICIVKKRKTKQTKTFTQKNVLSTKSTDSAQVPKI